MSAILILVRSEYSDVPSMDSIIEFHQCVRAELQEVKGFEDAHVWIDAKEPHKHLIIYRYSSVEAGEAGLKVVTRERILQKSQSVQSQAADVIRVKIIEDYGFLKTDFSRAEVLSMSIRIAEPGYAKEIEDDLERVFQECKFLNGFSGYVIGVNDSLEEEVIGLASWDSEEAFRSSLPEGIITDVASYKKAW